MTAGAHREALCRCVPAPDPTERLWRVRPRLGLSPADVFLGAVVATLVFACLFAAELSFLDQFTGGEPAISYGAYALLTLLYGTVPAMLVALGVGALVARAMWRVANQWWHLLAYAAAGAAIVAVPMMAGGGAPWGPGIVSVAGAALAGRAVLWRRFVPPIAGQ